MEGQQEYATNIKQSIHNALINATAQLMEFRNKIENKNIIIFLGHTRSGKSTLMNYVIGTELHAFKNKKHYKIQKKSENLYGPHIGQGSVSDTSIPEAYKINTDYGTILVDAPGFEDNRGEVQDVLNAIFVKQIKYATTCKFVLVSDINEFYNDNVNSFVSSLKRAVKLIPNLGNLSDSTCLVVTKDRDDCTQEDIAELLNDQILQLPRLDPQYKKLVQQFVDKPYKVIGVFKMPLNEGQITSNLCINVREAIFNRTPLYMDTVEVNSSIAVTTELALLEIYQDLTEELEFSQELYIGIEDYRGYFEIEDYVFASFDEELAETVETLNDWKQKLSSSNAVPTNNLQSLFDALKNLVQIDTSKECYKTLNLLVMLEEVGLSVTRINNSLIRRYEIKIQEITKSINKLTQKINLEIETRRKMDIVFTLNSLSESNVINQGIFGTLCSMFGIKAMAELSTTGVAAAEATTAATTAGVIGAASLIGLVGTVIVGAAALKNAWDKGMEIEKRKMARRMQNR